MGAGAKITGAFGDVFAKLTFDTEFIDKRQVERSKAPRMGRKLGGFAKVSTSMLNIPSYKLLHYFSE